MLKRNYGAQKARQVIKRADFTIIAKRSSVHYLTRVRLLSTFTTNIYGDAEMQIDRFATSLKNIIFDKIHGR